MNTQEIAKRIETVYGINNIPSEKRESTLHRFQRWEEPIIQTQLKKVMTLPAYSIQDAFLGNRLAPIFKDGNFYAALNTTNGVGLITYLENDERQVIGLAAAKIDPQMNKDSIITWYVSSENGTELTSDDLIPVGIQPLKAASQRTWTGNHTSDIVRNKAIDLTKLIRSHDF